MSCEDCRDAAKEPHDGFAASCKGCAARSIARIFLRHGERGRKFRLACVQFNLTEQQVREAWAADATNPERPA